MSETVTEDGTRDTTGVVGTSDAEWTQDTAQNKDTTGPMGESVDSDYEGDLFPGQSGTRDTTAVQGGHNSHHEDDPAQYLTKTPDTTNGGPITHKDPAYRAPKNYPVVTGTVDTTRTDRPISDGSEPDVTNSYMTGTIDTVNYKVPLQTTTENLPVAPGSAPTVAARPRAVLVTITPVANPTGAKVRGYRIEGSTGGVDFLAADKTSVLVDTLVPSQNYKFRYAAVNDNGTGPWSAWSAAVKPLNPDEPGPGHATTLTEANKVNPIYSPAGVVKPGTGGTTGPVATLVAAATSTSGQFKVDWTAPGWGNTPTNYEITLSTGEKVTVAGNVLTRTFTGLSAVARTATVVPINARGRGVPRTSNSATPLA